MLDAATEYLASRADKGELRPGVDPAAAAWTLGAIYHEASDYGSREGNLIEKPPRRRRTRSSSSSCDGHCRHPL